jgi:hypothetical protein
VFGFKIYSDLACSYPTLPPTDSHRSQPGISRTLPVICDLPATLEAQRQLSRTVRISRNYSHITRTIQLCILMGHSSKDRRGALLYTTARHFSIAFVVLTAHSPPNRVLCTGLFFSFAANQNVTILSVQTPSPLQCLGRYSPDHPYCCSDPAPSIQPAHLGTVCGVCWVPGHCGLPGREAADAAAMHGPLVSDRALGTGRLLSTSSRYFILVASRVEQCSWQQTAYGETTTAGVANLLQSRPEGRSHPQVPPDWSHTLDTRTLVTREADACLYTLQCPSYRGTYLGGLPSSP